jgi:RHS repeat-associated protein
VRTTAAEPFIRRDSIAAIAAQGEAERTLWQIADLYLVAAPESKAKLLTGFKAAPFVEAGTGLVNLRERWLEQSTGTFLGPDRVGYRDSSSLYVFCGSDPVNCSDPLGLARQTKNGGTNWFGDLGDVVDVQTGPWYWRNATQTVSAGLDFFGNTLSYGLALDAWADANVVVGDSSRSTGERAWAATKGVGIAAMNLVGGEIVGTAGRVLLKIPGARTVVSKIAASRVGRVLGAEVNPLRWFDGLGEAVARGLNEGLEEATQQLAAQKFSVVYIGKIADLRGVPPNLTLLPELPNLGYPKANYYQNMSVLRRKLREGYAVFDRSKFRLNTDLDPTPLNPTRRVGQTFLGAERNQLANRDLRLNPLTGRFEK